MNRSKSLEVDSIGVLLRRFSLPAILGMVVNALYNIVDSIFVGNGVGEIGLAAVTIAFPIMMILMGFGMLIGVGAAAETSLYLGAKQQETAEKILGNALTLSLSLAVGLTAVILAFLDPLLVALGAEPGVLPYARDFMRIILVGSVFMHIGFGLNSMIRAEGNPRTAMETMLISAVLNMILNPIFIFGFKMGISGSALATVISQFVSAVWVVYYFSSGASLLKLRRCNLRPQRDIVLGIIKIGLSPFLMQVGASAVIVIFNFQLMKYGGELAVASIGIIMRVNMLILMPIFGISQGVQPIIGYNYGARQYHRVVEALKMAVLAATLICFAGFAVVQLFNTSIIRLFNDDPQLVATGSNGLRITLMLLPVVGFQIISANYFQATGKAGYAILLSMSRQVVLLIPFIWLLPGFFGINGIWAAGPLSDLGSFLLTGAYLFRDLRKLQPANGE
ncbi:multi antimicrobial extrusion protein [Lucifera butyrica]|uniref:Multidrug export protein MepA n=1 Tax=Lucifera butyrica TaxID=1351585 RepID=A0A498R955_9FIRM|nr:MATE family efflux transporter [Lucifera butyrica]VBB06673.1 multi antimicrobial extrusion protein [Lucifera butyrica]